MERNSLIRIGVLGTAKIAASSVIPALLQLTGEYELVGVAGRDVENTAKFCKQFNIQPFNGYAQLLNKNTIDAVYIPLPNALHLEWVKKALEAGIHVLVEKSLGCSFEEVKELNELAKKNKLVLIENFQFRFHSQLQKITSMIQEGVIGELRCVRSSFGFPPFTDKSNIRYQKDLGGGAILDAAAYPVKIVQHFLGEDIMVQAASSNFDSGLGVDTWGGAFLKQNSGNLFAEIAFGFDHFYQCNVELWGTAGKLYTNRIFTAPPGFVPTATLENKDGTTIITLDADNHFVKMLQHFYSLIVSENSAGLEEEYVANMNQARLLDELKLKSE
mgnify:FL=1